MIDLNSIIQSAQGGQAVDHLAARFGLSREQTQSAIGALLPAVQMGLQNKVQGGGLSTILGHLNSPVHQDTYNDPAAAQSPAAAAHGSAILGDLFGGAQTTSQVSQQVATESGVPASIIQAMLPVIASMIMGGLTHGVGQGSALGGVLSSVLGSVFGQGGTTSASIPGQSGGVGGMLGSVLGGLFGGGAGAPAGTVPGQQASVPSSPAASNDALLNEISGMFTSGTSPSADHEAQLANILGR